MVRNLAVRSLAILLICGSHVGAQASLPNAPANSALVVDDSRSTVLVEPVKPAAPTTEADKLAALDQKIDAVSKNLTVTTGDPDFKIVLGGAVIADFLFSSARPDAPGTPFFLTPGVGVSGVVGQIHTTVPATTQVVADV